MNPTKRNFQLISAILSIVAGSIMLICSIIYLATIKQPIYFSVYVDLTPLYASGIISAIFSTTIIVLGSIFVKKNSKGIAISVLVLVSLLALFQAISLSYTADVFLKIMLLLSVSIIVITIIYLCLSNNLAPHAVQPVPQPATTPEHSPNKLSIEKKIEILKRLRAENSISEEEYQSLLVKYLESL